MGFYSFNCPHCKASVLNNATDNSWRKDAVALLPGESPYMGEYDGYGRLISQDYHYALRQGVVLRLTPELNPAVYHTNCWYELGQPAWTIASTSADDQGWKAGLPTPSEIGANSKPFLNVEDVLKANPQMVQEIIRFCLEAVEHTQIVYEEGSAMFPVESGRQVRELSNLMTVAVFTPVKKNKPKRFSIKQGDIAYKNGLAFQHDGEAFRADAMSAGILALINGFANNWNLELPTIAAFFNRRLFQINQ
jgi:hypothetical protein